MDLKIDFYDLGKCWKEQVEFVDEVGSDVVELELRRNRLKDDLDNLKAKIDLRIRAASDKKPTEAAIQSMVLVDPEYLKLLSEFYSVEEELRRVKHIMMVLETRRKALDGLTQLYIAGYFAKELPENINQLVQEEQNAKLNTSTTKKRMKNAKQN